jgi:hypothetical protein
VDATVQLLRRVEEGRGDPTHSWVAEGPRSGVAFARFGSFPDAAFGVRFRHRILFQQSAGPLGEDVGEARLKSEILAFFTARCLAISWPQSPATALGGTTGHDNITCNSSYLMDNTFRRRIKHGKRARTSSAGLTQLAMLEEEIFEEVSATDGSD